MYFSFLSSTQMRKVSVHLPDEHNGRRARNVSFLDYTSFLHVLKNLVYLSIFKQRETARGLTNRMGIVGVDAIVKTVSSPIVIILRCEDSWNSVINSSKFWDSVDFRSGLCKCSQTPRVFFFVSVHHHGSTPSTGFLQSGPWGGAAASTWY
jgi:hypothetical protein